MNRSNEQMPAPPTGLDGKSGRDISNPSPAEDLEIASTDCRLRTAAVRPVRLRTPRADDTIEQRAEYAARCALLAQSDGSPYLWERFDTGTLLHSLDCLAHVADDLHLEGELVNPTAATQVILRQLDARAATES